MSARISVVGLALAVLMLSVQFSDAYWGFFGGSTNEREKRDEEAVADTPELADSPVETGDTAAADEHQEHEEHEGGSDDLGEGFALPDGEDDAAASELVKRAAPKTKTDDSPAKDVKNAIREYLRQSRDRLKAQGLTAQWANDVLGPKLSRKQLAIVNAAAH